MSVRDQPGKDLEGGKELPNLRTLYDDTLPSGRVLISVAVDRDLEEHVVVPIPQSYEAAMTIAFGQLGEHIPTKRRSLLEGAYFRYCMRSPTGDVAWAKLPPEFWKEIIKDGDHLKLCQATAAQPERSATFFLGTNDNRREDLVISPLPESYQEAVNVIRKALRPKNPVLAEERLMLYAGNTLLSQANWVSTFATNDGSVEIRVFIVPYTWGEPAFSFLPHDFTDRNEKNQPDMNRTTDAPQFFEQKNPPKLTDDAGNERGKNGHQGRWAIAGVGGGGREYSTEQSPGW